MRGVTRALIGNIRFRFRANTRTIAQQAQCDWSADCVL